MSLPISANHSLHNNIFTQFFPQLFFENISAVFDVLHGGDVTTTI